MTLVAIHQPNFFPWLGFFNKIANSDVFIYLDHVQVNPQQTWIKRVRLMNQGEAKWLSIPTKTEKSDDFPAIKDIQINTELHFQSKQLRTIEHNYHKALYFKEVFPFVEEYYQLVDPLIANRNIQLIESICHLLEINTPRIRSSSLHCCFSSTDLLIEIVHKMDGNAYLCGGGATDYQDDKKFSDAGIALIYQNFISFPYPQIHSSSFIPGLSILDVLMNCGTTYTKQMLKTNNHFAKR